MGAKKITSSIPWWYWVAFIDFFLLFITLIRRYDVDFPQAWRFSAFDLAAEMNLSVWWSGMLLATISLLCYEFYLNQKKGFDRQWLSLSVVFLILSIDEICSFHERLSLTVLIGVYAPLMFLLALYPLIIFLKDIKNQKTGLYILFGFGFYASVLVQEIIEHVVEMPPWFLGVRVVLEEGAELLGTFVILFGILALREPVTTISFQKIIPKPRLDNSFRVLLWSGIFVHFLVCLFILPDLDDFNLRGNPGIFYPTIINFILFCFLFWKAKALQAGYRKTGFALSGLFLLSSMGCMYDLLRLVPKSGVLFPENFLIDGFQFLYVGQIVGAIIALVVSEKSKTINGILFIIPLVGIFALSFMYQSLAHTCLLLGIFSFIIGYFYSRLDHEAEGWFCRSYVAQAGRVIVSG